MRIAGFRLQVKIKHPSRYKIKAEHPNVLITLKISA
jgi:hypothetical protein